MKRTLAASLIALAAAGAVSPAAAVTIWDIYGAISPSVSEERRSPSSYDHRYEPLTKPGKSYRCRISPKPTACWDIDDAGQVIPGSERQER